MATLREPPARQTRWGVLMPHPPGAQTSRTRERRGKFGWETGTPPQPTRFLRPRSRAGAGDERDDYHPADRSARASRSRCASSRASACRMRSPRDRRALAAASASRSRSNPLARKLATRIRLRAACLVSTNGILGVRITIFARMRRTTQRAVPPPRCECLRRNGYACDAARTPRRGRVYRRAPLRYLMRRRA